jgi:hypothetical protein
VVIEAKAKELTVARYKQEYSTSKLINNQIWKWTNRIK